MAIDPAVVFTIDGTVLGPEGEPRPGVRLVAADVVDEQQRAPKIVVSAVSDASGRFSLPLLAEQVLRLFRTGHDEESGAPERPLASRARWLAIVAYSGMAVVGRLDLAITLDGLAKGYDVELRTTQAGEATAMHRGEHQVSGVLRDRSGEPVAGYRIEVLHRQLRAEVVIASTQSGSDGSFRLGYELGPRLGDDGKAIAIVVRALEEVDGTWEERVRSERFCPAPRTLELVLTLPGVVDDRTEIEKVAPLITARIGALSWSELTDDDAELIAGETGLPLGQVVLYIRAARLAERASLPPEGLHALYSLGSAGMTMRVAAIGALPPTVLQRALEDAATREIVPAWADVAAVATAVASAMGARAAADDDDAPLGRLLAAAGLPAPLRESFVVGYVGRSGTVAQFWEGFARTHTPAEVEQVRFSLYAGALASDHLPLVTALEQQRQAGQLSSPRELAALGLDDWRAIVVGDGVQAGTGAPEIYPGADREEREALFAIALTRAAEEAFPTAAIVQRVAKTGRWGLASSYVAEHPGLDFRTTNARQYLASNPASGLGVEEQDSLREQLSQAQRLFMVAPRFDRDRVAGTLLDAGIHSAQQIAGMGPSAFVETHGAALGHDVAKVVFDNAHHVSATLATLALRCSSALNPFSFPAGGGGEATPGGDAPPDLEGLLGPLDYCACAHCRSVLSPAAYLVDLLRFLEQRPALGDEDEVVPALAPFGLLAARRPDLLHTRLDCANTNTPLPTIDLVNEILEREVAGGSPGAWPQTTRPAAELRAQPEHRLEAAYDVLRTAVYPWVLPFDLARAESEAFLGHLGVARHELLAVCGAPSAAQGDAVAQARLGLTGVAAQIVAGQDVGQPIHALWGVELAQWPGALEDAEAFLAHARLDLAGLQALAATEYASGGQLGLVFATPCRLAGATVEGLDSTRRSRIHRFIRLQRALGWTIAETDAVIGTLGSSGSNPLDMECLRAIGRFLALHERFETLPRRELLAWFSDLSVVAASAGVRSHYEEVFVEVTAQGDPSPLSLGQPSVALGTVMPQLAAALSRSEDEVARILALEPARVTTTVANLSWLYRWSSLARALELRVDELVALVELTGVTPFAVLGATALDVVEALVRIHGELAKARVSVLELDALLRHQGPEPAGISAAAIAALLVELVRGLQGVGSETDVEGVVVRKLGERFGLSAAATRMLLVLEHAGTPRLSRFVGPSAGLVDAIDFGTQAEALADPRLPEWLEHGGGGLPSLGQQFAAIRWLAKAALLVGQLRLGDDDLRWLLAGNAKAYGLLSPGALPTVSVEGASDLLAPWLALQRFAAFGREHTGGIGPLRAALDHAGPSLRAALARATGWEDSALGDGESSIVAVATQRGIDLAAATPSIEALWQLADAFALAGRLGVTATRACAWAADAPTTAIARDIQAAAKARVPAERWPAVIEPLRDGLRQRQRDALVAYVLAHDPDARTPEDLFGRLLIDTQVSACAKTSRIKQALASVQTFVQRVQLHLEPGVNLSPSASAEWQWMSRYRVWEANRKIFLWPENWLQPELRDDETELFGALQNVLLERELSEASVEAAVTQYVRQLDEIAQLHVAGIYHERELGPEETLVVDRLHVFARTKARPYRWFYRARVDDAYWTPWEAVSLQIDAESVIPAVFRRRLMVFWPRFERRAQEPDVAPSPDVPLRRYYEIRMSWSVREDGRWGAVRVSDRTVSDEAIIYPVPSLVWPLCYLHAKDSGSFFFHTYLTENDNVLVVAPSFLPYVNSYYGHTPRFFMGGSREDLSTFALPAVERYFATLPPPLEGLVIRGQWLVPEGDSAFDLEVPVRSTLTGDFGSVALFRAPFRFSIAASRQYPGFAAQSPFVFQDRVRSLFVVPRHREPLDLTGGAAGGHGPSLEGLSTLSHGAVLPAQGAPSGSLLGAPVSGQWSGSATQSELQAPVVATQSGLAPWETPSFEVSAFSHPFAERLLSLARRHGIEGIYRPPEDGDGEGIARQLIRRNWDDIYEPKAAVTSGSIVDELDFGFGGAYSVYNWELFFHVPMFVAQRLAEDKKFAEARRWMHFVFDPTEGGNTPTPSRYWRVKPLFQAEKSDVAEQLEALQYVGDDAAKNKRRTETQDEIAQWRKNPFRPHALARLRVAAYQRWVLMRYLDNLVEWGDHLFRQDTIEANNEALQLYVLAAQLLGPRPTVLPAEEAVGMTYADVQGSIDEFANFLAQAENAIPAAGWEGKKSSVLAKLAGIPFEIPPVQGAVKVPVTELVMPSSTMISLAQMVGYSYVAPSQAEEVVPRLYFCVPHNEALLRYWDVVEDRLFKLRHCLNIEGVERQLPLFEPPLDPGLLAQAVAAGVDLSTALSDVGAPLPHYRFSTMLSLAKELAAEVRGLGSAVAEALRNTDAEALAELRASQESKLLATLRQVREQRIGEAEEAVLSIEKAIDVVTHRRDHYRGLEPRSRLESRQLDKLEAAMGIDIVSGAIELVAAGMALIPQFKVGINGLGPEATAQTGGANIYHGLQGASAALQVASRVVQTSGSMTAIEASYERRTQEWTLQAEQADKELLRLEEDLIGARLRVAIAKRELADHDSQLANARAVDAYMRERYTNAKLYRWLGSELSRSYFQAYQLAFEIAKQAQACYRYELGVGDASFIEFGYWDNRHEGLLAGERLLHDLRRMETSYLANNRREYELSKKVSLARIDPFALLQLQRTGECFMNVPEALYELDHPSHIMRRLRAVRLSVVGNTGPFDAVPVTLTLVGSRVRTSATSYVDPAQPVVEAGVATQSIATSTGQSDAGLFEGSLRDERYLPFEGKGAVSDWKITLPKVLRSFDYGEITDLVLELQYTAREGGQAFAGQVLGVGGADLRGRLDAMGLGSDGFGDGRMWALSVRSRFPEVWEAFEETAEGPYRAELLLSSEHFPHPLSGSTLRVSQVYVVLAGGGVASNTSLSVTPPGGASQSLALMTNASTPGVLVAGPFTVSTPPAATAQAFGMWVVEVATGGIPQPATLGDLALVVRYTEGG